MSNPSNSAAAAGGATPPASLAPGSPAGLSIGAQYIGAAILWGASFLFIKIAIDGLSPSQVVLGRLLGGAIVLAAIMLITRRSWPRGWATWGHLFAMGALMCVVPFLLFSWAAQYLPSALSSIYNATTPIMTMLVALVLLPDEKLTKLRTIALILAGLGIVLVIGPWSFFDVEQSPNVVLAQFACLGATACYGFGGIYIRRFSRSHTIDAITLSASQIGSAALIMVILTPFIALQPVSITPEIVISIVILGGLGTGVAYIWFNNVIRNWGATIASTITYLTPIVGVLLGVLILGEGIHWNEIVGGVVVIISILISQGRLQNLFSRRKPATDPSGP